MGSGISKFVWPGQASPSPTPAPSRKRKREELHEHLECPICVGIPKGNVFQCKNGHHLCSECRLKITNCPRCRVSYGEEPIRNLAMESLLDVMKFDCRYEEMGCSLQLPRGELEEHENSCQFRPVHICKLIGYDDCNFIATQAPSVNIIDHLRTVHNIAICHGREVDVFFNLGDLGQFNRLLLDLGGGEDNGYLKNIDVGTALWIPDEDALSPAILILCRLHGARRQPKKCSWTSIYIGENVAEASHYQHNFTIRNVFQNGQDSIHKWTNTPEPLKNMEGLLNRPKVSIPCAFLLDYIKHGRGDEEELGIPGNDLLQVTIEIADLTQKATK